MKAGCPESGSTCDGVANGKACGKHHRSVRERYAGTLDALGCICRALLALGLESCCETRERSSVERRRCSKKSSMASMKRKSMDSCSSTGSLKSVSSIGNRAQRRGKYSRGANKKAPDPMNPNSCYGTDSIVSPNALVQDACCKPKADTATKAICQSTCCGPKLETAMEKPSCKDACCGTKTGVAELSPRKIACCEPKKEPVAKETCNDACCGTKTNAAPKTACQSSCCKSKIDIAIKEMCKDACCKSKDDAKNEEDACKDACCDVDNPSASLVDQNAPFIQVSDPEKQAGGVEHVVLGISGMTCTGCETKLNRTLATMPAVRNLKTSLVLSRAEFDIDHRLVSVEDVMKHLERTTEFKCEKISNQGSSLDVLVTGEPSAFISQVWKEGITDMSVVGKDVVRVTFDSNIIGARDLLEKGLNQPVKLAPPRGDPALESGSKHVRQVGYMTVLSAILTIPVLVMAWAPLPENEIAYSSASLALATLVQVVIAGPFYPMALKALIFSQVIEMDLLIVLSTSTAYLFSVVSFAYLIADKPLSTGQFFETSTLLVTLIMVGRYVAALARQKAVESISIRSLQTPTAILVDGITLSEREIDARLLQFGDVFKVLPESSVPTDGIVLTGSSEVDESMITGESRPVEKHLKSIVIAGSINGPGPLIVRLTRLPGDNTISTIASMVDEAKLSKPKIQDLADKVASYFVPVVVALTIITFVVWVAIGIAVRKQSGSEATVEAITYAITVLIVSCPCAIGLAVPMVIVIASGAAAERGVVFKSADAIEVAYKTSHVVFDKTGTLTKGKLSVAVEHELLGDKTSLSLLLGLVVDSRHPVSIAVTQQLKAKGIEASTVSNAKSLVGKGMEATTEGQVLRAGNSSWLGLSSHALVKPVLANGYTVFCFTVNGTLAAIYGLEDSLRNDAVETVSELKSRGVSIHMVSGDDEGAVLNVASKLGIDEANVCARSSPAQKQRYIQDLLGGAPDNKKPVIIFCGDGTNDAVALAQATIGVHMNEGTDVAKSAADVVLMRPNLSGLLTMMNASRLSVNRIKFNFAWSFVYNTFAVLLAAGAFVNARIPPEYAGLGELVSVLPVIAAAVLLRWSKM